MIWLRAAEVAEKNSTLVMPSRSNCCASDNAARPQGRAKAAAAGTRTADGTPRDDGVPALSGAGPRGGTALAGYLNGTGTAPTAR